MEIKKQMNKVKCEMPGCKNLANNEFSNKTFFTNNKFSICDKCLEDLCSWYLKQRTPKSPVNMLNKNNFK